MKKGNRISLGIVFGIIVFGFVFPNEIGADDDLWANVPNLDLLNGTWQGTYNQSQTIREQFEQEGMTWDSELQNVIGDIRLTERMEITISINASAKTVSTTGTYTQTYSGGNIRTLWPNLKQTLEGIGEEGTTVNFNDTNYSIIVRYFYLNSYNNIRFQINQNGSRLKIINHSSLRGIEDKYTKIILTKR